MGLWGSSFKNAFHTLSYRFAAVILVILYSRGKGKELKEAKQGCIADTLTSSAPGQGRLHAWQGFEGATAHDAPHDERFPPVYAAL